MSNNISATNQTSKLTGSINDLNFQKETAKNELEDLFSESYFNGGQDSIDDIQKQIEKIDKQIKEYQQELKDCQDRMKALNKKIDDKSGQLSNSTLNLANATKEYEAELKKSIDEAITNAVNRTKAAHNKPGNVQTTFQEEFLACLGKGPSDAEISAIFKKNGGLNDELAGLCDELDGIIADASAAQKGATNAQACINLLEQTKGNMSQQVQSLYKNSNSDSKAPVYSYEKEAVVAKLADKYNSDLSGRNSTQNIGDNGGGVKKDQAAIDGYLNQLAEMGKASTGKNGDKNTADKDNALSQNLAKILFGEGKDAANATTVQKDSLVWKMAEAGMSNIEIMDAIAKNFGGINIKGENGKYSIPYGHGAEAKRIYGALTSVSNNTAGLPEAKTVPGDTKQLEQASDAVKELANAGFSFKEAMFALDQLFPGLDIGYNLGEQAGTKEGCVRFTSDPSYDKLAEQIEGLTKNGQVWQDSQVIRTKPTENKPADTNRTDPISVTSDDGKSRFYFMADDGNGKYDGVSDMLGYENGMDDFDKKYADFITTNGAGEKVITGDALKSIMVMKLEEVQNPDGSVGVKQSFMSAADAGMTEINLSSQKKSGDFNINGSEIQNTFTVKMGGKDMIAEQSMDDDEYLEATLNNDKLTGANMFSQLTGDDISKAFTDAENKFGSGSEFGQMYDQIIKDGEEIKKKLDEAAKKDDYGDNLYTNEEEFRKYVGEIRDHAYSVGEKTGGDLYDQIQAKYSMDSEGDVPTYRLGGSGEALNETIQKAVTEEIQKTYKDYGADEEKK